jgi:DedD protein
MEKKKLLLVAVSVGVFLVIVVSAAILVFRPSASPTPEITYRSLDVPANRSASTDASDLIRNDAYMGLQDPASASPIQENEIKPGAEPVVSANDSKTVINVPKPSTAAVPDIPPRSAARPAAQSRSAPAVQPAAPAAPAVPKQQYRDFWVQAGSFSTRERADGVKHTLDGKGIAAIITNQDINGSTYYRVRIGPYTSQNEADYWLAMVKSIDGFQDSQIWESQSFR